MSSFYKDAPSIQAKPWRKNSLPRRILAIRLQAMGDVVITLPYLRSLRSQLPASTTLDFLTRKEDAGIPDSLELFDNVYGLRGGRNFRKQLLHTFLMLPEIVTRKYDVVIDLQNNIISQIIRKAIRTTAWSAFDRYSPIAAGERTRLTIDALGLGKITLDTNVKLKNASKAVDILSTYNWDPGKQFVVLNPAGAFVTRNWSARNFIDFAKLWLILFPHTQFLLLGTARIADQAWAIENALQPNVINLTGKTTPAEAFAILQHCSFMLSEDSGLMHMAWTSGIPTLTLFGSTRSDWSRPLGAHAGFMDSSDLSCGNCMADTCRFGDVHCLSRWTPEAVLQQALSLVRAAEPTKQVSSF